MKPRYRETVTDKELMSYHRPPLQWPPQACYPAFQVLYNRLREAGVPLVEPAPGEIEDYLIVAARGLA